MATNLIRPATRDDLHYVAANLRAEDKVEVEASLGKGVDIDAAIYISSLRSDACYTWHEKDGTPIAVFGFTKVAGKPQVGVPWLLATAALKKNGMEFVRGARRVVREAVAAQYGYLFNYVHAENKDAVRYLKLIGFTVHEAKPYGAMRELFHLFDMGDEAVCINGSGCGTLLT